jgi:putative protease
MKRVELLSPAGNLEKLKIAIAYGADAVYGGVSQFSLRAQSGKEFTYDSFREGVEFAHRFGAKVYATVNSFPFQNQLPLVEEHLQRLKEIGVDGFIVSSLGVLEKAREIAPEIELHLSTQANALNAWDYKAYARLGVKRIIAARESSLSDLIKIKEAVPEVEIEIFVHGAVCFAYSGRCLLSALQFGRNPNKGSCANDCRYPYRLYAENVETGTLLRLEEYPEEGTYIFNAKDLCLIHHLPRLMESGVIDSFKIEGRTKSPYYVGVVTKAYRQGIDQLLETGECRCGLLFEEIATTKNRGFTDGFIVKRPYQRLDTQSLTSPILEGSKQVAGVVTEKGDRFLVKHTIRPGERLEIVLPVRWIGERGEEWWRTEREGVILSNQRGKVERVGEKLFLTLTRLELANGKEVEAIHSGNLNPVLLPAPLPPFTFLRTDLKR